MMWIVLISAIVWQPALLHPVYVSRCVLEYNDHTKHIEVSAHLFIDDLEQALSHDGDENLSIGSDRESPQADRIIAAYLSRHLQLYSSQDTIQWHWVGKELSEDYLGMWFYMESGDVPSGQSYTVTYDVLQDILPSQKNILQMKVAHQKDTYFLSVYGDATTQWSIP